MTPTAEFSVLPDVTGFNCRLYRKGQPLQLQLDGGRLLGAWQVQDKYLLLINDANGFEDLANLHLLDAQMQLVDSISLGSSYCTGQAQNIQILNSTQIKFSFPDDEHAWRITVLQMPRWRNPLTWWRNGLWKNTPGFKKYLDVHKLH